VDPIPITPDEPELIRPIEPVPVRPTTDETISAKRGTTPAMTETPAPAVNARPRATQPMVMIVGGAGMIAGVACVLALGWLRGDAPIQTAAAAPAAATATKAAVARTTEESALEPTWTGRRTATWANDGSKTVTFQLDATREVPVWMSRVRPTLVVRCLSRSTQAYVVIGTSASFEEDADHRTVRLQWDDGQATAEKWLTSESGQDLFVPNGVAFVRQLAKSQRLHLGFTPFNAQPATVEFAVQGFEQASLVASTCGWKL
jgi:hypothetical protein